MSKIDWKIHAITNAYDGNPLTKGMINMHTHGLNKYGLTELSVVTIEELYSIEEYGEMINTVARMMVEGEKFVPSSSITHYIDELDGTNRFKFKLLPATCFGEDTLRIIFPDINGKFFDECSDLDEVNKIKPKQVSLQCTTIFETLEKS